MNGDAAIDRDIEGELAADRKRRQPEREALGAPVTLCKCPYAQWGDLPAGGRAWH